VQKSAILLRYLRKISNIYSILNQKMCVHRIYSELNPNISGNLRDPDGFSAQSWLGWSRNFAKFFKNIYFVFCKIICFISRNFVSQKLQNFAKCHEIFVTKWNFWQGKIYFWISFHAKTTKKKTFISKIRKFLQGSGSVFWERIWGSGSVQKFHGSGTLIRSEQ
jgi:hypothetical protein